MRTTKTKVRGFWFVLFSLNIVFIVVMAALWTWVNIRIDLLNEKNLVVTGLQQAPTTVKDWFTLEFQEDLIDVNAVHQDILAPLQTNYTDYNNCSFQMNVGDGIFDTVLRDGDEACGMKSGCSFYARKNDYGVDIYVLVDRQWYHYVTSDHPIFIDFKEIADSALSAEFSSLPSGDRNTSTGYVFEQYAGSGYLDGIKKSTGKFNYIMMSCGHLREVEYKNLKLQNIENIGKVSLRMDKFVDYDNVIEVDDWRSIFNQARKSFDSEDAIS